MYATVHKPPHNEGARTPSLCSAFDVVGIAGSAGGIEALSELLAILPENFPAAILVVQHLPPASDHKSLLDIVLGRRTRLAVKWAEEGEQMRPATVFLAPQDRHLSIDSAHALRLTAGPKVNRVRPSADPLFASIAAHFGTGAIAVVLSGSLADGAEGAYEIARNGGRVLVQDNASSQCFDMPCATIAAAGFDFMFAPAGIAHALVALAMTPGVAHWFRVRRVIHSRFHARLHSASTPPWCEDPIPA